MKILLLLLASIATSFAADSFEYRVFRSHIPRKEAGRLTISTGGVEYRSDNGKTKIDISLLDIIKADVADPKVIQLETYDMVKKRLMGRQTYEFRLQDGAIEEALVRFLSDSLPRPVVGAIGKPSESDVQIRAYHRHRFGGCHGTIHFAETGIYFVSDRSEDSRTWLFVDIQNVGTMNEFHFRIATLAETFNFDLKERLPSEIYSNVAQRIYDLPGTREPVPSRTQQAEHVAQFGH